jgi:ParB family chromosome partitioning protein
MTRKLSKPSPILASSKSLIESAPFLTRKSAFNHTFEVDITLIEANPGQARKHFADDEIQSLAQSLLNHGQLQPIIVRRMPGAQKWVIVAGERRYRAAKAAGWKHLLAVEHAGDDLVVSLVENLQRVNLSPVEEARGLSDLLAVRGISQEEVAGLIGKTKSYVSGLLGVLSLPNDFLDAVLTSELHISKNILIEAARLKDPDTQKKILADILSGTATIRDLREHNPSSSRKRAIPKDSPFPSTKYFARFQKTLLGLVNIALDREQINILKAIQADLSELLKSTE